MEYMRFYQIQFLTEMFFGNDTPKFMSICDLTKNETLKYIFCRRKGSPKEAHPVPLYMIVRPPPQDLNH